MKMTDEIFQALTFYKDKSYGGEYRWYLKGNSNLNFSAETEEKFENVIHCLKNYWIESAEENLRSSFRSLLGIND